MKVVTMIIENDRVRVSMSHGIGGLVGELGGKLDSELGDATCLHLKCNQGGPLTSELMRSIDNTFSNFFSSKQIKAVKFEAFYPDGITDKNTKIKTYRKRREAFSKIISCMFEKQRELNGDLAVLSLDKLRYISYSDVEQLFTDIEKCKSLLVLEARELYTMPLPSRLANKELLDRVDMHGSGYEHLKEISVTTYTRLEKSRAPKITKFTSKLSEMIDEAMMRGDNKHKLRLNEIIEIVRVLKLSRPDSVDLEKEQRFSESLSPMILAGKRIEIREQLHRLIRNDEFGAAWIVLRESEDPVLILEFLANMGKDDRDRFFKQDVAIQLQFWHGGISITLAPYQQYRLLILKYACEIAFLEDIKDVSLPQVFSAFTAICTNNSEAITLAQIKELVDIDFQLTVLLNMGIVRSILKQKFPELLLANKNPNLQTLRKLLDETQPLQEAIKTQLGRDDAKGKITFIIIEELFYTSDFLKAIFGNDSIRENHVLPAINGLTTMGSSLDLRQLPITSVLFR